MKSEKGIVYVAYGEKALRSVRNAIAILRRFNKTLPVCVISEEKVPGCDMWIQHEDKDLGARAIKTRVYFLTPYEQTLYMDADTEVQCDPEPYFRLLKDVDMVMGQDPVRIFKNNRWQALDQSEIQATIKETDGGEMLYYNSGVILFEKNVRVEALMRQWHTEWKRWKKQDQPALLRALYRCPVRIATMRNAFNTHQKSLAKFVYHAHRTASRQGAPK
jgi:hypothetical protein